MALGVHSEVGKLRKVMVHRPGLEHTRLTPSNAEELLFDDVLWVTQAKQEHDAFCEVDARARRRGLRGRDAAGRGARRARRPATWVVEHILNEREVGIGGAEPGPRVDRRGRSPAEVADFLIGGITRPDVERDVGLVWQSSDPTDDAAAAAAELPVPARPVLLDLRRRHAQPDDQAGPQAGDDDRRGDLPLPPDVRRRGSSRSGSAAPTRTGAAATSRAATSQPIGNGTVMIGMGERTTPQAVLLIARELFRAGCGHAGARRPPAEVAQLHAPRHRHHDVRPRPGHRCSPRSSTAPGRGRSGPATAADDLVVEEQRRHAASRPWPTALGVGDDAGHRDRRRRVRGRARAVGRRQQRRRPRARRRRRLRAQHRHQHGAAQGRHRGHHHRGLRARPGPRRLALHDLPASSATPAF